MERYNVFFIAVSIGQLVCSCGNNLFEKLTSYYLFSGQRSSQNDSQKPDKIGYRNFSITSLYYGVFKSTSNKKHATSWSGLQVCAKRTVRYRLVESEIQHSRGAENMAHQDTFQHLYVAWCRNYKTHLHASLFAIFVDNKSG